MKILIFCSCLISLISCTEIELVPTPPITSIVDDSELLLKEMRNSLVGSWDVTITQTTYPTKSSTDTTSWSTFSVVGEVDCNTENQWDYLKRINISQLTDTPDPYRFKVINEYYCRPSNVTIFEVRLEKPYNVFLITEKINSKQNVVVKSYRVTKTTDKNIMYLRSESFDPTYFHYERNGSIKFPPTEYAIRIEKK